jgi:hypothetical protein
VAVATPPEDTADTSNVTPLVTVDSPTDVELHHGDMYGENPPLRPPGLEHDGGELTVPTRRARTLSQSSQLSQDSRISSITNSSQDSSAPSSQAPTPPPPEEDTVLCSVQTQICIDKLKSENPRPVSAGTMTIHNNIDLKASLVRNRRICPHVMLKLDPKIPRQYLRNVRLLTKPYALSVTICEIGAESNILSEDITKPFTLKEKLYFELLSKEKWLDSDCSRVNVVIRVIEKQLCVFEPTPELDFVKISLSASVYAIIVHAVAITMAASSQGFSLLHALIPHLSHIYYPTVFDINTLQSSTT